jgi:hypothetical protein
VDDLIVASNNATLRTHVTNQLTQSLEVRDLGNLQYFLGFEVVRQADGTYFLSQSKYAKDLLERSMMDDSKPVSTPITVGTELRKRRGLRNRRQM